VKLCRDCQLVGGSLSEAQPPLLEADCQVAYTAEVRAQSRAPGSSQKMNYNDFLTALMKLAIKVYPRSHTGAWRRVRRVSYVCAPLFISLASHHPAAVDEAFQRMLMDNVLPLASRRCPDNIDAFLESSDVQRLFGYYSDALEGVFTFYATSDKRSAHALLTQAVKLGHVAGPFAASQALTVAGRSPARATRSANTMKEVRRQLFGCGARFIFVL
jgi:hypothetical protein